jgi:adenylosuccinate lyase
MRRHGVAEPYERLKELTRGQRVNQASLQAFIAGLELPEQVKQELAALAPWTYTGNAAQQAAEI